MWSHYTQKVRTGPCVAWAWTDACIWLVLLIDTLNISGCYDVLFSCLKASTPLHHGRPVWMCATFSKWRRSYSSGVPSLVCVPFLQPSYVFEAAQMRTFIRYSDRLYSHCASVAHVKSHFEWMRTFWYQWLVLWSDCFSKWFACS